VFTKLQEHSLFVKKSKCAFCELSVAYLGHVITDTSVAMDAQKMCVVLDWPPPHTVCVVCAFFGLAGYYRQFIKDYVTIVTPLLHKDGFRWSPEVEVAFRVLQRALTMAPAL
jgi:hypothetical protein